jgi:hypothetical protein
MSSATFQPLKDTTLASAGGGPFGSFDPLTVGNVYIVSDNNNRPAITFDLGTLLFNTVSAATLTCTATGGGSMTGPDTFYARRLTTAWAEATADWSTPWTTPGGDYTTTGQDSFLSAGAGTDLVFSSLGTLAADAVASRAGLLELILIGPEDTGTNDFQQLDSLGGSTPPSLAVTYTALPVLERVALCLAYRLGRVTTANGYNFDLTVNRSTRDGVANRGHGVCTLQQAADPQPLSESDVAGNPPGVAHLQPFDVTAHVAPADNDTTPVETTANLLAADVQKAIATETLRSGVDWALLEGLAIGATISPPAIDFDGEFLTVGITVGAAYRVSELDPTVVR